MAMKRINDIKKSSAGVKGMIGQPKPAKPAPARPGFAKPAPAQSTRPAMPGNKPAPTAGKKVAPRPMPSPTNGPRPGTVKKFLEKYKAGMQ